MDQWDFKKWRKKLGINQVVAGELLGLSRGAVQYWESDLRLVPRAVELACQELLRRWQQRPEFGPVTLLYSDSPISQVDSRPSGDLVLRCEPHPDNDSALGRLVRLSETLDLFMPLIVDIDEQHQVSRVFSRPATVGCNQTGPASELTETRKHDDP